MTLEQPPQFDDEMMREPAVTAGEPDPDCGVYRTPRKSAASTGSVVLQSSSVSSPVQQRWAWERTKIVPPWSRMYSSAASDMTTSNAVHDLIGRCSPGTWAIVRCAERARRVVSVQPVPERRRLPFDPIAEAHRQWAAHGWVPEAPAMATVTSIMRLQQVFLARADVVLRPFGLTFARYEVVMLLSFSTKGSLPLGKIGERLQVNAASVTNAVDRLEAQGLVVRRPNPRDGRGTLAAITAKGRKLADRATVAMNAQVFSDLGLDAAALETLFAALGQLRRSAGDFD